MVRCTVLNGCRMTKTLPSIIACVFVILTGAHSDNQEEIFEQLTNDSSYNKRIRPHYDVSESTALVVNCSMYLFGMSTLDDLRSEYQMTSLLRLRWLDHRLAFNDTLMGPEGNHMIVGDDWHAQRIWIPTINVVNDRGSGALTNLMAGSVLIHIEPEGRVLLSMRVPLRLTCNMKYHNYPLDKQICRIEMESTMLSERNLLLQWSTDEPIILDNFDMPGFYLAKHNLSNDRISYMRTGNFSRVVAKFQVYREFRHFLLEVYVPTTLFVVTSWTSFFVDIPSAPARVTIGITSMLTLVTSLKSIREKLPRYSYISAMDVWNFVCTAFVFASLVEYTIVNFIYNREKRRRGMRRDSSAADLYSLRSHASRTSLASLFNHAHPMNNNNETPPKDCKVSIEEDYAAYTIGKGVKLSAVDLKNSPPSRRVSIVSMANSDYAEGCALGWLLPKSPQDIANGIDKKCRFVFPSLFAAFNIIYWSVVYTNHLRMGNL